MRLTTYTWLWLTGSAGASLTGYGLSGGPRLAALFGGVSLVVGALLALFAFDEAR